MRSCVIVSVLPSTLAEVAGCGLRPGAHLSSARTQAIAPLPHLNPHKHAAVVRPPARMRQSFDPQIKFKHGAGLFRDRSLSVAGSGKPPGTAHT